MQTVMQRWSTAKANVIKGINDALNAIDEANSIVKEKTGQSCSVNLSGPTGRSFKLVPAGIPGNLVAAADGVFGGYVFNTRLQDCWALTAARSWPVTLSQAEAMADWLSTITTGGLIAAWETSQE